MPESSWQEEFIEIRAQIAEAKETPSHSVRLLADAVDRLADRVEIVEQLRAGYAVRAGASIADLQPGDLYRPETPT